MKFNWGHGIALALLIFCGIFTYFLITVHTVDKYEVNLITEDYYKKELDFQQEIDKTNNALKLSQNIVVKIDENNIIIVFPNDFDSSKIQGNIKFFRPSDKKLDIDIPIKLEQNKMVINKKSLQKGLYKIIVDWSYLGDEKYMFKEDLYL